MNLPINIVRLSETLLLITTLLVLSGCMTVSGKQSIVESNSTNSFAGKRVAVLPVKAQTSLAPDSVLALRNEINKRLGPSLRGKLVSSGVLEIAHVANLLNQRNALPALEQLVSTYENTGIIDRRQTNLLGQSLGTDYLVFSRLKAEKLDIFLSKGMGASLEIMIIDTRTGDIAWGGSGEWKRGGIFGLGGATAEEAADHLVNLSLNSLPQASGSAPTPVVVQEPLKTEPPTTSRKARSKKRKSGG